jgi:predicted MFS family arabinose efflux permease
VPLLQRSNKSDVLTHTHCGQFKPVVAQSVSFIVRFAVHSGVHEAAAGLLLAAMGLASTLGRLVFGAISDRPGREVVA